MGKGSIICFTGPSGVGKTSYAKRLIEKYNFILPTIVTTRLKRTDDGENYMYVSEELFLQMLKNGSFVEWDKYLDCYYGTLLNNFNESLTLENVNGFILDLTPSGCNKIKEIYPLAIIIAILPDDSNWLIKRLISRNSQPLEEIERRTAILEEYIGEVKKLECDFIYANYSENSWDETFKEIERIISKKAK